MGRFLCHNQTCDPPPASRASQLCFLGMCGMQGSSAAEIMIYVAMALVSQYWDTTCFALHVIWGAMQRRLAGRSGSKSAGPNRPGRGDLRSCEM